MTNNDILRRLRYALNYYDATLVDIFALGGHTVTLAGVADFLKKEDEPATWSVNSRRWNASSTG